MKSMYNEEQNRKAKEYLEKLKVTNPPKRITNEEFVRIVNNNGLTAVRRIDVNNKNITDNIAFINKYEDRYCLIITNEKGMITTKTEYDDIEEAYAALVDSLMTLKSFV